MESNSTSSWFDISHFMPHGHCYMYTESVLYTHLISDALIALAYFSIPGTLLYFLIKKQQLRYSSVVLMFVIFITACGLTHAMAIWTIWEPRYYLQGALKAITALASITTAALLIPILPRALALPTHQELENEVGERKHAQQELAHTVSQLEITNRELEMFAYAASHDLKAPLRNVANFCQLLQRRYDDQLDDDGRQYIEYAVASAKQMQALVDDLLHLSRAGHTDSPAEQVDLQELVTAIEQQLSHQAFQLHYQNLPTVMGYPTQLRQVLTNLIDNAIKFTRNNDIADITITAEHISPNSWEISVRDQGVGIPADKADTIFDVFTRAHADSYAGTGIGLAICRKMVALHGGSMRAEANRGAGSTFFFTLPQSLFTDEPTTPANAPT